MGRTRTLGEVAVVGALLLLASAAIAIVPTAVQAGPPPPTFVDAPAGHPFAEEISWAAQEGIAEGYPGNRFKPGDPVTRQAMAAFLHRFAGEPDPAPAAPSFPDVGQSHPFLTPIAWLAGAGITTGYEDGTFRPAAPVTRQSTAAFLFRFAGEPDPPADPPTLADVPAAHPFHAEITWLAGAGITTGYVDGTFRPGAVVTRQAMAAFLFRFAHLPDPTDPPEPPPFELGSSSSVLGSDPIADPDGVQNVWLNLGATSAPKQSGDRYASGSCTAAGVPGGPVTGCTGTGASGENEELDLHGHVFRVRVDEVPAGQPLQIQVYDPAWTRQGDRCDDNRMSATQLGNLVALAESSMDDAVERYGPAGSSFDTNTPYCAGDQALNGNMAATAYIVRSPDQTPGDSFDNPVVDGCVRTFTGRNVSGTGIYQRLVETAAFDEPSEQGFEGVPFREHFRQWFTLCTIPSEQAQTGDYLVQVRSNPDTSDLPDSALQADPDANPGGHNRFALRAGFGAANHPEGAGVRVEPVERRVTSFNAAEGGVAEHDVARVTEDQAGEVLGLELFDVGDVGTGSVAVSVLPPADSGISSFEGCTARRDGTPSLMPPLSGCGLSGMTSTSFNGRTLSLGVPIPEDYQCDEADPAGCWVRVRFAYSADATPTETYTLTTSPPPAAGPIVELPESVRLANGSSVLGSDPIAAPGVGPNLWVTIGSRNNSKHTGDRYLNGSCSAFPQLDMVGCGTSGTAPNAEYVAEGRGFLVRVHEVLAGQPLQVQVYDPAWTSQGDLCTQNLMSPTQLANLEALPEGSMADATVRYGPGTTGGSPPSGTNTPYCPGDQPLYGNIAATSYIVRTPDGAPIDGCVRTFTGRNVSGTGIYDRLRQSPSYDEPSEQGFEGIPFHEHFRQWSTVCTIPAGQVQEGDYLLQVRNNPDTSDLPDSALHADPAATPGSFNRIALRAGFGSTSTPDGSGVVVEPTNHFTPFINGGPTTVQPLLRVPPQHAGETVEVELFDVGDVYGGTATIELLPPVDSGLSELSGCTARRDGAPFTPLIAGCGVAGMTGSSYDGRVLTMVVPIPDDYDCDDEDPAGCLIRLSLTFGGGVLPIENFTANLVQPLPG